MDLFGYNFKRNLHIWEFDGICVLLDVNSGSLVTIDDSTRFFLEKLIGSSGSWEQAVSETARVYDAGMAREIAEELTGLYEAELLFTSDRHLEGYRHPSPPVTKALCLNIAHACNLRCEYCFASRGDFGGEPCLMSAEVGKAAIDFLIRSSGNRVHLDIDYFGGEPLLNLPVVKEVTEYARQAALAAGKVCKFTLTTNAVLLTPEVRRYLLAEDFAVVLSMDGRQAVHDRLRVDTKGRGSYDRIRPNVQAYVKERDRLEYYVRGTYTRYNLDFCADVKHLVEDLGFYYVSLEPVVTDPAEPYALREEDLPAIYREYDNLTRYVLKCEKEGPEFDFYHFRLNLAGGPCLIRRLTGCGAGFEYLAVTPHGELYPCHQLVGREEFRIGDVWQGLNNLKLQERFRQAHVYNKPECQECWARFYCSGGCHANAEAQNGDILKPYRMGCMIQRKRIECALYLAVKRRMAKDSAMLI